jgi:very-short-patch-repair endonuclease
MTEILDQRYDFLNTAAFDLSSITPILLKEHFRCAEEISDYFNDAFYANELHIRTDENKLKTPTFMGYRHAVEWIDIHNSNTGEIEAVEKTLKTLIANDYPGTIGVITPFKKYADDLKGRLYPLTSKVQKKDDDSKILISTANSFQGGERDVILFVLGYNDELTKGKLWYAESPENRYIYNVAVSRARACLIIIGDKTRCANSNVSVLKKLSELPRPKKTRIPGTFFDSIWEEKLYYALSEAGIETHPQYPVMGRRLDLAFIRGDLKIDIEIDGVHYHTDSEGNRKLDDIYRDLQIGAIGWKVKRFWVHELRDNMENCVKQVKNMIKDTNA